MNKKRARSKNPSVILDQVIADHGLMKATQSMNRAIAKVNKKRHQKNKSRPILIMGEDLDALNEAILVHGITQLASKLKITIGAIQNWRTRGIPPHWVVPVEKATGISRTRLRPDLYA